MFRLIIILLNFFIVCVEADAVDDFIDIFSNEKDCTSDFNEFYADKNNLMVGLGLSEVDSTILQKIFIITVIKMIINLSMKYPTKSFRMT